VLAAVACTHQNREQANEEELFDRNHNQGDEIRTALLDYLDSK
jgi:hypothetical protein